MVIQRLYQINIYLASYQMLLFVFKHTHIASQNECSYLGKGWILLVSTCRLLFTDGRQRKGSKCCPLKRADRTPL